MWDINQWTKVIKCKRCGKEIIMKWRREYCIPCRREVDREIAIEYRAKRKAEKQKGGN